MKFNSLEQMATSSQYEDHYFKDYDLSELTIGDVIDSYVDLMEKIDEGSLIYKIEREIDDIYNYHFNAGTLRKIIDNEVEPCDLYGEICIH